jgi:hypothetical protein
MEIKKDGSIKTSVSIVLDKDLFTCQIQQINPLMLKTLELVNKSIELENRQKELEINLKDKQNKLNEIKIQCTQTIQEKLLDSIQNNDFVKAADLSKLLNSNMNNDHSTNSLHSNQNFENEHEQIYENSNNYESNLNEEAHDYENHFQVFQSSMQHSQLPTTSNGANFLRQEIDSNDSLALKIIDKKLDFSSNRIKHVIVSKNFYCKGMEIIYQGKCDSCKWAGLNKHLHFVVFTKYSARMMLNKDIVNGLKLYKSLTIRDESELRDIIKFYKMNSF